MLPPWLFLFWNGYVSARPCVHAAALVAEHQAEHAVSECLCRPQHRTNFDDSPPGKRTTHATTSAKAGFRPSKAMLEDLLLDSRAVTHTEQVVLSRPRNVIVCGNYHFSWRCSSK